MSVRKAKPLPDVAKATAKQPPLIETKDYFSSRFRVHPLSRGLCSMPPYSGTQSDKIAAILKAGHRTRERVLWVFNFFLMFIFERERERERQNASGLGAEREGDTESEAGSRP